MSENRCFLKKCNAILDAIGILKNVMQNLMNPEHENCTIDSFELQTKLQKTKCTFFNSMHLLVYTKHIKQKIKSMHE